MTRGPFEIVLINLQQGAWSQPCARPSCTTNLSQPVSRGDVAVEPAWRMAVPTRGGTVNGGWMHLLCAIDQANEELAGLHSSVDVALNVLRGETR